MLLDLALDGNGGFPDVIDILGIDATGNSYANLLVGGKNKPTSAAAWVATTAFMATGRMHHLRRRQRQRPAGGRHGPNDRLIGGAGRDNLYGQAGSDVFDFNSLADNSRYVIRDFVLLDYVDLSTIDANARVAGNQGFRLIGATGPSPGGLATFPTTTSWAC